MRMPCKGPLMIWCAVYRLGKSLRIDAFSARCIGCTRTASTPKILLARDRPNLFGPRFVCPALRRPFDCLCESLNRGKIEERSNVQFHVEMIEDPRHHLDAG